MYTHQFSLAVSTILNSSMAMQDFAVLLIENSTTSGYLCRGGSVLRRQCSQASSDIDLDTYDAIRTCCSGPTLCQLCWCFLSIAVKVIDRALRG